MEEIVVGIDVGTTKVCALVGRVEDDKSIRILGVGIEPSGDTVYAPADGIVVAAQPSGHAFGLVLDGGIELLIHVGIDTVQLKGEGFDVKVTKGQKVTAGTPLVTFDRKVIEDTFRAYMAAGEEIESKDAKAGG